MSRFKDNSGDEWVLPEFTLGVLKRIHRDADVKLLGVAGDDVRESAMKWYLQLHDPEMLGRVLWVLLADQAEKKGTGFDAFAERLGRNAMEAAREAVIESLLSFTQTPEVAKAMKADLPAIQVAIESACVSQWKSIVSGLRASAESTPKTTA